LCTNVEENEHLYRNGWIGKIISGPVPSYIYQMSFARFCKLFHLLLPYFEVKKEQRNDSTYGMGYISTEIFLH
jgi:hypothetical protein